MKVIGLTGGIGSGKSTVSSYLTEKGFLIIDADKIAHDITKKGSPVLIQLAQAFGVDMLDDEGNLNRKKLAAVAFSSPEKKAILENLTTKEVVRMIAEQVAHLRNNREYDIIFVDAPLLFESGADKLTDLVWMVSADEDIRIARVMARDNISKGAVLQRIANQMSNDEKIRRSNELIDNSKGKEELYHQVDVLLKKYA